MDESTDIAVHKKLAVCVRYVDDGNMVTKLLTNVKTESATAASIVSAVRDLCHTFEFHMDKLVGFGSDGASVMTGKGSGVAVRLRRDLPPYAYVKPKIALAVGEIKGMKNVSGPLAKGF